MWYTASGVFNQTSAAWLEVVLTVIAVLMVPTLLFIVKGAVKWTRTEDQLGSLVDDVRQLVTDKDKVHAEIMEQIRTNQEQMDRRVRFMEEWMMRQKQGSSSSA